MSSQTQFRLTLCFSWVDIVTILQVTVCWCDSFPIFYQPTQTHWQLFLIPGRGGCDLLCYYMNRNTSNSNRCYSKTLGWRWVVCYHNYCNPGVTFVLVGGGLRKLPDFKRLHDRWCTRVVFSTKLGIPFSIPWSISLFLKASHMVTKSTDHNNCQYYTGVQVKILHPHSIIIISS